MAEPLFTTVEHAAAWRKEHIDVLEGVLKRVRQELADCTRDGQRLSQLLAEEEDITDVLKAALHALTRKLPTVGGDEDVPMCAYCYGSMSYRPEGGYRHTPDCPWVTARELLEKGQK